MKQQEVYKEKAMEFAACHANDNELKSSVQVLNQADPVELIKDFDLDGDERSETSTDAGGIHEDSSFDVYMFFHEATKVVPDLSVEWKTKESMNPLKGFEIITDLQEKFHAFVDKRDDELASKSRQQRRERMHAERSSPVRRDEHVVALFEEVVRVFARFIGDFEDSSEDSSTLDPERIRLRRVFGFKYCPTPGSSADKVCVNLFFLGMCVFLVMPFTWPDRLFLTGHWQPRDWWYWVRGRALPDQELQQGLSLCCVQSSLH
jgi:hypothetical protein